MKIIGLLLLVIFAAVVGAATHWFVGVLIIAVPVLITYIRIKSSPAYKAKCDYELRENER